MHYFKIFGFHLLLTNEPAPISETNECHFGFEIETDTELDLFVEGDAVNAEAQIAERDLPIRIDLSFETITEDVIEGQIRLGNDKGSEEASFFRQGFFESGVGDFLRGRVDSLEAVLIELPVQNLSGLFYFCDPFPNTGSHKMILEPAIRPLHFPLGGRRQGVNHFDPQVFQNFLPLNNGVFLFEVRPGPDRVSLFDVFED